MPTYEFRCPDGHVFDRFYRKISDSVSELPCPECGKIATRQLSGGAGLVFKGSGFYLTDYGKNAHRGGSGSSHASSSSNGKSESTSDSKSGDTTSGDAKSSTASGTDSKSSAAPSNSPGSSGTKSDK